MSPGDGGGVADEMGSRHRNGVAALLACHGLVDRAVNQRDGAVPVKIELEADGAVDDIVCAMQDDAVWYIQSKRSAGNDKALRSAIAQWVAQPLRLQDRVVLSSRVLTGLLRDLQPSLDRLARDPNASLSEKNLTNTEVFLKLLRAAGSPSPKELMDRVILLNWEVEDVADRSQQLGIEMLANSIVEAGSAPAAFETLRARMQLAATRREVTTSVEWLRCLTDAGLTVYSDRRGPGGARKQATMEAIASYRAKLAGQSGVLDVSALCPEVPELRVTSGIAQWTVECQVPGDDDAKKSRSAALLSVVRRNRRFILSGQPGMGKSELMRQLSFALAADDTAPLPIHVDLRDVAADIQTSNDVTLDVLLRRPSQVVARVEPLALRAALSDAVHSGHTLLIVDGLDETRHSRGVVARGLARLLEEIPQGTGFVLSTRRNALDAAEQLRLPTVQLESPANLRESMLDLLRGLSEVLASPADREIWFSDRSQQLNEALEGGHEIWKVPLLATLATLRIARNKERSKSAAELLNGVVDDSVTEWEARKLAGSQELDVMMRPEMLLTAFAALGHELSVASSLRREHAESVVSVSLAPWNLSLPMSKRLAKQAIHFWDDTVGVFVVSDGVMVPRSRQFAELGDVRWAGELPEDKRRDWLRSALDDPDSANAVSLATAGDATLRDALIRAAERGEDSAKRVRASTWVASMWADWGQDDVVENRIVNLLADAAEDKLILATEKSGFLQTFENRRLERDGGGWSFVLALVDKVLSDATVELRAQRLARLKLTASRRTIVDALTALVSAKQHGRPLADIELEAVIAVVRAPLPVRKPPLRRADGVYSIDSGDHFVSGGDRVIELAVDVVGQLPVGTPDHMFKLAKSLPMSTYGRVTRGLAALGYADPNPLDFSGLISAEWIEDQKDHAGFGWLLRELDRRFPEHLKLEPDESWRLGELCKIVEASEWAESSTQGFRCASREPSEVVRPWIDALVECGSLRGPLLGAHARALLARDDDDDETFRDVILSPNLQSVGQRRALSPEVAVALVPALRSKSEWIAHQAFVMLLEVPVPGVAIAVDGLEVVAGWQQKYWCGVVALFNAPDSASRLGALAQGSSADRAAAAIMLRLEHVSDEEVLKKLASDEDATVRHYANAQITGASSWTCIWCSNHNEGVDPSCGNCNLNAVWT